MSLLKLKPDKLSFDPIEKSISLVKSIPSYELISEIYVIGSAANGTFNSESDLDIVLVVQDASSIKLIQKQVYKIGFSDIAVDWIIKTSQEFNEKKDFGGVCFEAFHYGKKNKMIDNKKRLFKKEYAKELLKIAEGDFDSAMTLEQNPKKGRPENIVFLIQQSVEMAIKAVLVFNQIPFPLVHDLGITIALLPDDKIPPNGFNLIELNPFASVRRYEDGQLPLTQDEIKASTKAGKEVLDWAKKIYHNLAYVRTLDRKTIHPRKQMIPANK